jgi:hypothetical protein
MLLPLIIGGCGISMAMPAARKSVVGAVAMQEIGKDSGALSTLRIFGGVSASPSPPGPSPSGGAWPRRGNSPTASSPRWASWPWSPFAGAIAGLGIPGRREAGAAAPGPAVAAPPAETVAN